MRVDDSVTCYSRSIPVKIAAETARIMSCCYNAPKLAHTVLIDFIGKKRIIV